MGSDTEKSWVWSAHGGLCRHSMRSSVWEGEPGRTGQLRGRYATGDVVGLLLDLSSADGDGELVALKDGEELGTLVYVRRGWPPAPRPPPPAPRPPPPAPRPPPPGNVCCSCRK
eukprot:COSAG01_NODE_1722_length_9386_cov_6.717562_3_plen_114_part_00